MIVTLTGENAFALRQELNRLTDAFTAEHGDLALERLDGETADAGRVQEALYGLPMLAARKMVILRGLSTNKQLQERAEQLFADIPETTEVILVEPKLDKRLAYYKFLKKQTDFREFAPLDQAGLSTWLVSAAKERGGAISAADARYLVERVGPDQQLLAGELEKLLLYNPKITRQNVDELTDATPQSTIFQLLEAAFAGNGKRALHLYSEQRALNVEPIQIIAMLSWQLHVLAILKTAGDRTPDTVAKEARFNPFVVRKSQSIAQRLTLSELRALIRDLLRIDLQAKRTNLDADEALKHYLLKLAN